MEPPSPTSLSDPGSEVSSNSVYPCIEHQWTETLNRRMAGIWSSRHSRSDVASDHSAHGDDSPTCIEHEQQHSYPLGSMPCYETVSQSMAASETMTCLRSSMSANGSATSRSSLSSWQEISQDLPETFLMQKLELSAQSHQASAVTLHPSMPHPEQLQYSFGYHIRGSTQPTKQLASATDSLSELQHRTHQVQPLLLPHSFDSKASSERGVGVAQKTAGARTAHFVAGAQAPQLRPPAALCRPQDSTDSIPATQCNDVVSTLSGIPEQVRQLLESAAHGVAEEVHEEVAAMRRVIRCTGETEIAVEKLESIPDLILNSFEGTLMRVKDKVRRKVNNVIEDLDHTAHLREDVVKKLYTIPEEVVNITAEAMEEVSQDSKMISAQQIDDALLSVPWAFFENRSTLCGMRSNIVASVPDASSSTSKAVRETATEAVEQAVASICDSIVRPVNELVADQLLRRKAVGGQGSGGGPPGSLGMSHGKELTAQSGNDVLSNMPDSFHAMPGTGSHAGGMISSAAGHVAQGTNPGNLGHPELCPRPCIYFARGMCTNEGNCDFCHLPHPRRPAHLDKSHRELLKRIPLAESVMMAMPILRGKARALSLPNGVAELFDQLEAAASGSLVDGNGSMRRQSGRNRKLQGAMRGITMRSLLTALYRSGSSEEKALQAAVGDLVEHLRSVAPGISCDDVNS